MRGSHRENIIRGEESKEQQQNMNRFRSNIVLLRMHTTVRTYLPCFACANVNDECTSIGDSVKGLHRGDVTRITAQGTSGRRCPKWRSHECQNSQTRGCGEDCWVNVGCRLCNSVDNIKNKRLRNVNRLLGNTSNFAAKTVVTVYLVMHGALLVFCFFTSNIPGRIDQRLHVNT